jgi:hypothetical protein
MQDVIFSIPNFAKALLRIIGLPCRYVFLEKRSADMKFSYKKKFRYGIPAYTDPFIALCIRRL